jgi:hypothetical protein
MQTPARRLSLFILLRFLLFMILRVLVMILMTFMILVRYRGMLGADLS